MVLDAVGLISHPEGLDRTGRRSGEGHRARRRGDHLGGVPLQAPGDRRQAGEQRVAHALGGELDLEDADLGRGPGRDPPAERVGQELMAQADAEEGHPPRDGLADGRLLRPKPRVPVLLPDIHGPAHDPERVVAVQGRYRRAGVELDRVPAHPVGGQEVPEGAGMLDRDMLKDQDSHGFFPLVAGHVPTLRRRDQLYR